MFNDTAVEYDRIPLTIHTGQNVRIWLVNAGPTTPTAQRTLIAA